jgi:hypothetical protein
MIPFALVVLALVVLLPSQAFGAGLPAEGVDATPLYVPGGQFEYRTERAGHDTRVIESARYGGPVRERRLDGRFLIPAVAYDGSPSGLSADGRTLVLINPRRGFPAKRTTIAVVDVRHLRVRRHIELDGDFAVDAIAPDGNTLYLIEYPSRDMLSYAVRAYDMRAGRLLAKPVVDPDEADEPMTGAPVTRLAAPDGRWQYTLYQSEEHPFIHALDTTRRTAVCIDLLDVSQVWNATLMLRGERLEVSRLGRPIASIDLRTHRVIAASSRAAEPRGVQPRPGEDAGTSWLPLAAPTAALLLLAAGLRRRRSLKKPESAPITGEWEQSSDRHAPTA